MQYLSENSRYINFVGSTSDVKLKVEVDGFNWDRCNELYKQSTGIRLIQSQLCAGGKDGEDSCQGDSGNETITHFDIFFLLIILMVICFPCIFFSSLGGPLMGLEKSNHAHPYRYLAGIVSFGLSKCGTPGKLFFFLQKCI